ATLKVCLGPGIESRVREIMIRDFGGGRGLVKVHKTSLGLDIGCMGGPGAELELADCKLRELKIQGGSVKMDKVTVQESVDIRTSGGCVTMGECMFRGCKSVCVRTSSG